MKHGCVKTPVVGKHEQTDLGTGAGLNPRPEVNRGRKPKPFRRRPIAGHSCPLVDGPTKAKRMRDNYWRYLGLVRFGIDAHEGMGQLATFVGLKIMPGTQD